MSDSQLTKVKKKKKKHFYFSINMICIQVYIHISQDAYCKIRAFYVRLQGISIRIHA